MQIIDVDISEMQRARRRSRARSPETTQLIEAIESLDANSARGVIVTPELTEKQLRARLAYSARIAGRRIRIASDGDKVMFTLAKGQRRRRRPRGSQ